jgi:natural product biosynthesis luciferase-like monooxygenase protein
MVPAGVVRLPALPRTPNGKLDRGALPAVDAERLELSHAYVAPATDEERRVAATWSELLGVPRVGAHDDFFELGGHSLLAMRTMARLRRDGEPDLPVRLLFEHPTVASFAAALAAARGEAGPARPPLAAHPRTAERAPAFAQQRLWLLHQLLGDSPAYNLVAAIRLVGRLDRAALERAVSRILERHESLRTVFPNVDGQPRAVLRDAAPVALEPQPVASEGAMRARVAELAARPYDLERGPLFRAELIRLAPEEHVLSLGMHHIVSDGWSRGVLYDELARLYEAYAAGRADPLPPLPIQFSDFAAWQADWSDTADLERHLAWWKEHLAGAPATSELPARGPRPATPSFRGATIDFPIPESLARAVRRLGAEEGATPFMVYLAALSILLGRYAGQDEVVIGTPTAGRPEASTESLIGFFVNTLALKIDQGSAPSFRDALRRARTVSLGAFAHQDAPFERVVEALALPRDLSRSPLFQVMFILQNTPPATYRPAGVTMTQVDVNLDGAKYDLTLSLVTGEHGLTGHLEYSEELFDEEFVRRLGGHFVRILEEVVADPDRAPSALPLLTPAEERLLLVEWNQTARPLPEGATVHGLFEEQARRTPAATALVFGDETLTYRELDERASRLAAYLRRLGVGAETLVGVCVERSLEMVVGLLGILKAGGAYVPLDPTYPRDRLAFMVEDSGCPVVLTSQRLLGHLPGDGATRVCLDRDWPLVAEERPLAPTPGDPARLAYVIFTSGSTGRPKGVMVEHRNVVNFFTGMDERVGVGRPITWLAVTSISFDISVLELFWTLARGCTVVVQPDEPQALHGSATVSARPIDFSLFYFASEAQADRTDLYHLLFEGARFADDHGFSAVWVPERHFHAFGGIYPNPSVVAAALAAITRRVKLRSGSVVLPLHDTLRVAEDWAVVDNISRGRVELSFASGWHDRDFVFQPQNYADRRNVMARQIQEVRALWRGETVKRVGGEGTEYEIGTLPRPVQPELPIFVTAAGTPETFERAGKMGGHLLTHLLGQTLEQLAERIRSYRAAWQAAGHPGRGTVALMVHTFVHEDADEVRRTVWHPFREYLRTSVALIGDLAKGRGQDLRSAEFTKEDMEALLDHAFERYYQTSALMGTPESCLVMVERLKALDVDDVACLIDFGIPEDKVVPALALLADVRRRANPSPGAAREAEYIPVPAQIERHAVTHLQCTPSYAEMLLAQPGGREALARLECLMVGGEALPPALAQELTAVVGGRVLNMYGPTETTVWSSTQQLRADEAVTLGRPIANTELFVLDRGQRPVPVGVPGELLIGGRGVVRGYWRREALTLERFVAHPSAPGRRAYRTGDVVRYLPDGRLEFLGRVDHQVKVRGHRIELGEIEALLRERPGVRETVVVAREDVAGDKRLVAYLVADGSAGDLEATLREHLRTRLPDWMVPQHVVTLDALPRTPNGKIDRARLPAPRLAAAATEFVAPASQLERTIAEVWADVLRRPSVGTQDNFFDLGGHSLLTVRVQARLRERLGRVVAITDLFRFPTVRSLAERLGQEGADQTGDVNRAATERGKARRGALSRRRGASGLEGGKAAT